MESPIENLKWHHETEVAHVTLEGDPSHHGVVSLYHHGSTLDLIREPYFALNVYRFMDAGRLLAIARDEPFHTERTPEGMTLRWAATEHHPAELAAEYRITTSTTIDLHITSTTLAPLKAYEVYLSSYFDFTMDPLVVVPQKPGMTDRADQRLLKLEVHPLIQGHYIVFPKNSYAAALRFDGRWIDETTGKIIAPWIGGPFLSHPIAVMSNGREYVVQMVEPRGWLALGTTYAGDRTTDSIVRHNALYISLFGGDTRENTVQRTTIRQVLCQGEPMLDELLAMYDEFLSTIHESE